MGVTFPPCHPSIFLDHQESCVIQGVSIDSGGSDCQRPALVEAIEADFKERLPDYHKSRREGLAALAGVMLETREPRT